MFVAFIGAHHRPKTVAKYIIYVTIGPSYSTRSGAARVHL